MNRKHGLLNSFLLGLLATYTAVAIAMDASLLEMSEQMDKIENQDFQAAIERAMQGHVLASAELVGTYQKTRA